MLALTKFADENNLSTWLIASPAYGSNLKRLVKFYKRFGFELVINANYRQCKEMCRMPN